MKRKFLFLVCAVLMGCVEMMGYTGSTPTVGKAYYLFNTTYNQYWYATSTPTGDSRYYHITSTITNATPVYIEDGGYIAFYIGSTKYYMNESNGTTKIDGSRSFEIGNNDGKYYIYAEKHNTKYRCLNAEASEGNCNFPDFSNKNAGAQWQFISCDEVAETHYVTSAKGWEKVTSVAELKTSPENYFFAIFSANAPGLMVDASSSNAESTRPYYKTATNPLSSAQYLFEIENYDSDGFALKSCDLNKYFGNNSDSWNFQNLTNIEANCKLTITLNDGAYQLQSANADWLGRRYWGLYDYTGYTNGQKFAGNKSDSEKGSFLIYRIAKKGLDMTSAIVNPSFETGNTTGWSYTEEGDHGAKDASNETYEMEGSVGNWLFNIWSNGHTISQTLPNMPAGIYKLTAVMGTDSGQEFRLTMGDATGTAASVEKGTGVTVETYYKLAVPGSLAISADAGGSQWYKVDNFRLTYMEPSLPGSLEEVTALMNITKKTTANTAISKYNTAISTYNSSSTSANLSAALTAYHDAEAAIAEAESSAEAYASVSSDDRTAYRTKMAEVLEQTNVYTADAYNKWYAEVESNYSAGVYTDAEVVTLNAAGAYSDGWHSASCIDDVLLSNWTIGGSQCHDFDTALYINTWSTEGNDDGSNFRTPFFEYWTENANSLDATTLVSTVSGLLPSSTYTLSIWCRVRQANDKTKVPESITLQVGSGDAVDLTSGTQVGSDQFYLDYFTATGSTNASGVLTITINVAENSNISWLSFQKVQVKANVTVSAKAGKYGTVIFPFTPDVSEGFGDITFYNCASTSGATLVLTEETTPVADKPYIIKNDGVSNFSTTLSGMVTPSATTYTTSYTAGYLTGFYTAQTIPAGSYVLQTQDNRQAFYKLASAATANQVNRAYLTVPASNAKAFFFYLDDADAINDVRSKMEDGRSEIFNLAGQRVSKLQKGVNIVNGKKVLVK